MSRQILVDFDIMGFTIYQGYGLTESSPVLTCNFPGENRYGSVGKPLAGVEIKIAGPEAEGEILARGPNIMMGYHKRQDLTAEVLDAEGWLHTGDIGHLDKEGYLYITGRAKDVIVTAAGMKVFPEEIEQLMKNIPAFKESAVLGITVKKGVLKESEEVAGVIVPNEGYSNQDIHHAIDQLNHRLPLHKRIVKVLIRKEELQKTRLLKVKKYIIRKELEHDIRSESLLN